jgi:alpha-glucosidase
MKSKFATLITVFLFASFILPAQNNKALEVASPDGLIILRLEAGAKLQWSVKHKGKQIIAPSVISLQLQSGEVLGDQAKIISSKVEKVNSTFAAANYKKAIIQDQYNQMIVICKGDYGIILRVYNDGAAYRFFTKKKEDLIIKNEEANFNFASDYKAFIPFVRDLRDQKDLYISAFESDYKVMKISEFYKDTLAILPLLVDMGDGVKTVILEADLEDYPGMFMNINQTRQGFKGVYAGYPLEETTGGFHNINYMVSKRADYIAKVKGTRNFPWRAVVISQSDKELANNDMVQKLASPSRITDISWIRPGKVAWDWWNDWNITHVDFRAGINTPTYKYYIDFAAANKIEYVVMDEGWSEEDDITKISPKVNLEEILAYGKQKGVDIILWATWYAINKRTDEVFSKYSKMGVKGFKIDFLDRDDQKMVASTYEIARKAAGYKLMVDLHGMFKPTGIQRTYPNVIGFEGVKGMENVKWTPNDDVPFYDVTIPFIRMMAGPMDYTPGAMRNATKGNFHSLNSMPMSQGTRCHQLAMYIVFEAPLGMLSDNPTAYMREPEITEFIAKVPTTFEETVALDGKVGEYIAIARRKGDTWYVGAMSNWDAREITLDFSFLGTGNFEAEIFKDGINADRDATDYKKETIKITSATRLKIQLSNGGGWAASIRKVK